jgi:adenosylmethionine-8-amino-7-oxononanoate aminotransferase
LHSHSYTGNPLSVTAAIAGLEFLENENILQKNQDTIELIREQSLRLKELASVTNIRQQGMIFAFDVLGYKSEDRIGLRIYEFALKHGVLIRPLGNVVYFMPPYVIKNDEIIKVFDVMIDAVLSL